MKTTGFFKMLMIIALGCGAAVLLKPQQSLSQVARIQQASLQRLPATSSHSSRVSPNDYVVGSEDLLEVQFFGQEDLNRQVRVDGHPAPGGSSQGGRAYPQGYWKTVDG